eukprot:4240756-Pleurochrysis_carterae.AAC.1
MDDEIKACRASSLPAFKPTTSYQVHAMSSAGRGVVEGCIWRKGGLPRRPCKGVHFALTFADFSLLVALYQLWIRGYDEVVTPNMYNMNLWHTSGHAAKYKENMFCLDIEGQARMRARPISVLPRHRSLLLCSLARSLSLSLARSRFRF